MEKIFVIGLPKTGLSTIGSALSRSGFKVNGSPRRVYGKDIFELETNFKKKIPRLVEENDVFLDVPWCTEYQWLAACYPKATFLLTYRDPAQWAKSYIKHFEGKANALHYYHTHKRIIKSSDFEWLKEHCLSFNEGVENFFRESTGFYKLGVPEELTWERLGDLTGKDLGVGELPVVNPAYNRSTLRWWFRNKTRAFAGSAVRKVIGSL